MSRLTASAGLRAALPCLSGQRHGVAVRGHLVRQDAVPAGRAQGTSAYRVGFSALILCLIWRPWRMPMERKDLIALVTYGAVMGR